VENVADDVHVFVVRKEHSCEQERTAARLEESKVIVAQVARARVFGWHHIQRRDGLAGARDGHMCCVRKNALHRARSSLPLFFHYS
jgi:hypothetical protein